MSNGKQLSEDTQGGAMKQEVWMQKITGDIFLAMPVFYRVVETKEEPQYPDSRSIITYITEDYVLLGYVVDVGNDNDVSFGQVVNPKALLRVGTRLGYL